MRSLQIVENSPQQLVAVQTPYTASFLPVLGILIALGFGLWFAFSRQWLRLLIPGIAILVFGSLMLLPKNPTYHLRVDRAAHQVTSEGRRGDAVVESFTASGSELAGADMQFNRGASTIVLTRRDGSVLYPFGEQQLQDEPDQYVVLTALRDLITPATNPR